ncbi:hypothetical protein GCM10010280_67290 [Streptomyces pilosus]|uniref:Uncharacterized protein n=1 Tax=Streptomyces pilosus TaxID=28893 RepID=A0A918F8E2_9ACTN|nr:hypothetical protein GCM10010280_67290 [Streptomyces pilosus]
MDASAMEPCDVDASDMGACGGAVSGVGRAGRAAATGGGSGCAGRPPGAGGRGAGCRCLVMTLFKGSPFDGPGPGGKPGIPGGNFRSGILYGVEEGGGKAAGAGRRGVGIHRSG